jgi:hypothetical protein
MDTELMSIDDSEEEVETDEDADKDVAERDCFRKREVGDLSTGVWTTSSSASMLGRVVWRGGCAASLLGAAESPVGLEKVSLSLLMLEITAKRY